MRSRTKGNSLPRKLIDRLRALASKNLKEVAGKPLSEKALLDMATLDSVRAVKH